jgi:hypothetical protein
MPSSWTEQSPRVERRHCCQRQCMWTKRLGEARYLHPTVLPACTDAEVHGCNNCGLIQIPAHITTSTLNVLKSLMPGGGRRCS